MPCYSYSANNVINFVGNVEIVLSYTGNGVGVHYSYSTLTWICEFPIQDQLRVYSRIAAGNPETELVQGTDFTIDTTNNRINLITAQLAGSQVVIRRSTPSNRMIYKFVDGAKLTAKELNASFHQLLFLNQEKDFLAGTNIYNYYPIFKSMSAWTSGTSYIAGDFVTFGSQIYKCILATSSENPLNQTYWQLINNQISSFIVIGGPNPLPIDLTNLSIGKALVWNGTAFTAQSFTSSLSTLTDINTAGAVAGDILRYNGTQWIKVTPSIVDLTANNLLFKDRTFYNLNTGLSYTNNNSSYDVSSKTFLNVFKNGNNWVLTDPPTVYHVLQKTIPSTNLSGSQDPEIYFNYINTALTGLGANLSNPVKLKFFWNLGEGRVNIADLNAGNAGTESYQTYYWDKPGEFHAAVSGYLPVVGGTPTGLKYHAVETSTQWHLISPFFYQVWNKTPSLAISSFTSKIKSYGVKSFYLSVPECFSTPLANIPSRVGGNWVTLGTFANLTTQLNALGGETVSGYTYRDYYLMGLRDMAFAAARPEEAQDAIANGGMRAVDAKVRLLKGVVLAAEYSGLGNVDFNRYEEGAVASVLWKIPRQIIYYNKLALAFGNKDTAAFNTSSSFSIKNEIRFQGYQSYQDTPTYSAGFVDTNNTIAGIGRGTLFKAEEYWSDWNQKWAGLSDVVPNYRFNQADIDWFMYNIQDGTAPNVYPSNIGLYKINARIPPHTIYTAGTTSFGNGHETSQPAAYIFPWPYRPNRPKTLESTEHCIGTTLFNIDANRLFSDASNFLPDPEDEYVFRIIAKKGLTSFFSDASYSQLKTSIILEHGFSDSSTYLSKTPLTSLDSIFNNGQKPADKYRADSRIDKSKIRVYVKNESLEDVGGDIRYVITLAIRVPRIKSIGYAKVFRKMFFNSVSNAFPAEASGAGADTDIDSGPWNWDFNWEWRIDNLSAAGNWTEDEIGTSNWYRIQSNGYSSFSSAVEETITPPVEGYTKQNWISGRNECAVKFTRVGIPGDMWIRLSVLNTDGTLDLLDSNGFTTAATTEP